MTSNDDRGDHTHDHDHDHPVLKYSDDSQHDYDETGRYALMSEAMKELLIEKDVVKANEVREYLEFMDSRGEHIGAEIIAKAWTDPDFKQRLLDDGNAALAELGIDAGGAKMTVVENTDKVQNVAVDQEIRMGHHVSDCQQLLEEHGVDMVVMNTKDDEQLAMHGLAYPLAIELRETPLLLL